MRVIAGAAKGRRLEGPKGSDTRPMTDRAKEAIFSSIAADVGGADVIDLYAGTGSMGLEALSRGADSVVFVERDRSALAVLQRNIDTVGLGGRVLPSDVAMLLAGGSDARFDLAFVDPPYAETTANVHHVLAALVDWLRADAVVVLHRRVGEPRPIVAGLIPEADRQYGTAQIWRFRRAEDDDARITAN